MTEPLISYSIVLDEQTENCPIFRVWLRPLRIAFVAAYSPLGLIFKMCAIRAGETFPFKYAFDKMTILLQRPRTTATVLHLRWLSEYYDRFSSIIACIWMRQMHVRQDYARTMLAVWRRRRQMSKPPTTNLTPKRVHMDHEHLDQEVSVLSSSFYCINHVNTLNAIEFRESKPRPPLMNSKETYLGVSQWMTVQLPRTIPSQRL